MKIYSLIGFLLLSVAFAMTSRAQTTLEKCIQLAEANYPLIKQYGLLEQTLEVNLDDINRGWLPHINVYAQGTAQNVVPSFPAALSGVLEQMGQNVRGLGKFQYKAGVDISQPVWDGGTSKSRREIQRASEAVQKAALDVELYALRLKVENIYFATLLTEEQIEQTNLTIRLLEKNLQKLGAMLRNGTAMQCDVDMMEAQLLSVRQSMAQARNALRGYRQILGLYTGENMADEKLELPEAAMPTDMTDNRPELQLFEKKYLEAQAQLEFQNTGLMPGIGFFAQAYYGYPGFDYFQSMMNRRLSFNILAGLRLSWNIDALYTKKNNASRTSLKEAQINAERETFLFNNRLQADSQLAALEGLKDVMADDERIVTLRCNVTKAAESQLDNGIIDVTALLAKITDENVARLTAKLHYIQYLQEIYKLKHTLNK